jgi:2,4-dienoyl-CoA reductase-like NADH-dependent reductase (Old Yellow Enzyme family)
LELKTLFSPKKIGNVQIKNRIVRSATFERKAEKYGNVGSELIEHYKELAQGGSGLIITGFTAVDPSGTASPNQACLYDDSFISGHQKLVKTVHDYSDVKIAVQIAHTGRQGLHPKYHPIAPSPIYYKITDLTPRELKAEEIKEYIKKFINVGRRAYESGYDMVQLHAAHGYFLCNFISPYTNKRKDEFGGTPEKRTKILVDIYNGLRDEIGNNFPIIIKLQTQDFLPEGLKLEEGVKIAKILSDIGFDAIEPSGGGAETQIGAKDAFPSKVIKSSEDESYFLPTAKKIKPHMKNCALILMGGIKNPLSAELILKENYADFISMCRPLIYEPDLPNRWKSGDLSPAKCKSCNSCYMTILTGPVYCVVKRRLERKKRL